MNYADALEKVRKLLRLANSSNPHEAALAASRAQEIMDRYKIQALAVASESGEAPSNEPIRDFGDDPLDRDYKARWKMYLAHSLGKQNQCVLFMRAGALCLVGRASDVQTVRYLYGWLTREIERLATIHCSGNGRTYWNNFRLGAQETVCDRLKRQGQQTLEDMRKEAGEPQPAGSELSELFAHSNSSALVLIEKGIALREKQMEDVEAWTKVHMRLRSAGGGSSPNYNANAREAGRRAGHSIGLRPAAGRLQ